MKLSITRWFFFFVFYTSFLSAQVPYLDKYDGIPIIAHTNKKSSEISNENLLKMKELGIYGFYATDLDLTNYDRIKNQGLKMFPLQIWTANSWVVYYTDAIYTKWEAEGKGNGLNGDMELKHNTTIGIPFTEGDTSGIVTNSADSAKLIYGPGYYQYITYKQLSFAGNDTIKYTANYRLKVKRIDAISLPTGYLDSTVCKLQIVATNPTNSSETPLQEKILTVRDFLENGGGWDIWELKSFFSYPLKGLVNVNQTERLIPSGNENLISPELTSQYMQYKVVWQGRTFLKLYVDYIEIYDQKANELRSFQYVRDSISSLVSQYADTSGVLGWFGLNEPFSIDNYEPFRIVDSLVQSVNPNLHLYTTFTTGYTAAYGGQYTDFMEGNGSVYPGTEFIKRSKLKYLSLNTYMYDYPYFPGEESYRERNIALVTDLNLIKLRIDGVPIPLSHSTQSGRFCDHAGSYVPSNAQMNYHINLGLLFGMKELTCDPFFTLTLNNDPYREGLVNFYDATLTPLGQFWIDTIKPRMRGTVGKTIKALTPTNQYPGVHPKLDSILNHNFIKEIEKSSSENSSDIFYIDLGFFSDPSSNDINKKYFMTVNRYYSNVTNIKYTFKDLFTYKNWEVTNFVTETKATIVTNTANEAEYTDIIPLGDAGLYSVLPVVKYGGALESDETISEPTDLSAPMTIASGATLSINGTYNIYGNITVNSGGNIVLSQGSQLNFFNGSSLNVNGTLTIEGNFTIPAEASLTFLTGSSLMVNGTLTIEDNLTIPSGAALTLKLGSVLNFGNSLTIDGTLNIEDGFSLPAGATLTLNQGANVTLANYSCFFVNGTLNACGATFDRTLGETHNWGSIIFDGQDAWTSVLDNVTVNNASSIEIVNGADITIQNSSIQNCGVGIAIYNASPQIRNNQINEPLYSGIYVDASEKTPTIMNNSINKSSVSTYKQNQGIILYNGTCGWITHNKISGFDHGIYAGSSSAYFVDSDYNGYSPNNLFSGNRFGIMAGWGSYILGSFDGGDLAGNNSIYGNDEYDIYVYQYSNVDACYNYWGGGSPNQYVDGTSDLEVLPILTSDPWGSQSAIRLITQDAALAPEDQQISTNAKSASSLQNVVRSKGWSAQVQATTSTNSQGTAKDDDEFLKGIKLKREGKIDDAIEQFKKVMKDKKYGLYAITELAGIKTRYQKEDIQTYFEDLLKDPNADNKSRIKKALAGFYLHQDEVDRALALYDELNDNKNSKRDNFEGLYEKFNVMLHKKKDLVSAKNLLAELKNKFSDDADAMIHIITADVLMSGKNNFALEKKQSESEVTTKVDVPKEYALFNNYPNPFNPVTTITYQLPKDGYVTLKIFDVLGNEARTLVNDQRSTGTYTIQFDASTLSSGMYIYQLRVNEYTATKKMLLVK